MEKRILSEAEIKRYFQIKQLMEYKKLLKESKNINKRR